MDDASPTDSDISDDESDRETDMRPVDWDSHPLAIPRSAQENHSFTALGPANPITQETARPRPKQTARKSSARRSAPKAQTARKQTARKAQSTGKITKSTPKAKAKPQPKPKTQGTQKKAPAKKKSEKTKKGPVSQEHDIIEFQCRLVRANGLPN